MNVAMKHLGIIFMLLLSSLGMAAQDDDLHYYGLSQYLHRKVNYDLVLFRERKGKFIPDNMQKLIRADAITYYPWPYSPTVQFSKKSDTMSPTCLFARDKDAYYFILSLKKRDGFPDADISVSPFLNVYCEDGNIRTFQLDSKTPLIESLWYMIKGSDGDFGYTAITDEVDFYYSSNPTIYDDAQNYWLSQYHLDIVFRVDDIEAFLNCRPIIFNFLGGQYVFDFSDSPKFLNRLYKSMKQSCKRLDRTYGYYENYMIRNHLYE